VSTEAPSYKGFRFPAEIISHGVWLCHRFPLRAPSAWRGRVSLTMYARPVLGVVTFVVPTAGLQPSA
jgi:hypothetical protein